MGEYAKDPAEGAEDRPEVRLVEHPQLDGQWSCILTEMSCRFGGGAGGPGGNPKAALGGMGLLILGTGALWTFNNALFNGTKRAWLYEMV